MAKTTINKLGRSSRLDWSVGRRAKIRVGGSDLRVVIVEDRGAVGSQGRRLVRVRPVGSADEIPAAFEVPADELVFHGGPRLRPD